MNEGMDWTRWAVIHELGHVFDARRERLSRMPGLYPGTGDEIYGTPSERMMWYVPYNEDAKEISEYAATNISEDFAESWAATLFRGDWGIMSLLGRYSAPPARKDFVSTGVRGCTHGDKVNMQPLKRHHKWLTIFAVLILVIVLGRKMWQLWEVRTLRSIIASQTGCVAPCWRGLQPQKSTEQDIVDWLESRGKKGFWSYYNCQKF